MGKPMITALPIIRALAILGVIMVHATSFSSIEMTDSPAFYGYTWFNIFFKYGTPTFILLSSLVLFYQYGGQSSLPASRLKRFYTNRLKYILLPYAICSFCYFFMVQITVNRDRPWDEAFRSFGREILTGSAYTHLYFVFISLQFYILFPLLLRLCRSPKIQPWMIPIGFILQWGFVIWNNIEWHIVEKGSIALSYMSVYAIGAFFGLRYHQIEPWLNSWRNKELYREYPIYRVWNFILWMSWLAAALLHVHLWYVTRSTGYAYASLVYEALWNIHTVLSALVLMQIAYWIQRSSHEAIIHKLSRLGELSFGIYLLHPVWLALHRQIPWHNQNEWLYALYILVGYALALGLSWLLVSIAFRKISWSWIALGAPPRENKAEHNRPSMQKDKSVTLAP